MSPLVFGQQLGATAEQHEPRGGVQLSHLCPLTRTLQIGTHSSRSTCTTPEVQPSRSPRELMSSQACVMFMLA